ncbi:MAG TPA: efflux RND transporter periplasmic adaptor subunit, partial [Vicinamibacterales bacterium]|nr:efflux RND transporter periplasmic adaptor subunit [Vicinamibacterales bacterium]
MASRPARWAKWLLPLVVVVTVAAWVREQGHETQPDIRYETATVERGSIIAKVTASGTLSALVTVQVGSQVSGRVQEILVDYNSPVKAGQVIAKLDPLLFQAAVDQSRANHLTAESNLKTATAQATNAERQYSRSKSLLDRHLVPQSDFDSARANYDVSRAQVDAAASSIEVARAALHQAELNLGYATIVSPIDGTVISRNVDVGQTVASAFQAPTLFLIARDLRRMQVDTSVSEADVGRLETGVVATFTVDAYPGQAFSGRVRQIRSSPTTVQNVVTYDAVLDVDNGALQLKPGMTANVTFVVAAKHDVLEVPNRALRFQPDPSVLQQLEIPIPARAPTASNQKTVWALSTGRPAELPLVTGVTDGSMTEILQGAIHPGDAVITDMTLVPH